MAGIHRIFPTPPGAKKAIAASEECLAETFPLPFLGYTEGRILALLQLLKYPT